MESTQPLAWLNGQYLPFSEMKLPVWDLGVVAGASLTEMARTYRHQPFRLTDHIERLQTSCDALKFDSGLSDGQLQQIAEHLVQHNTALISDSDDLGIVLFVTAGANPTYLGGGELPGPSVGVHTFRLPFEIWKTAATEGVRLRIPSVRQPSDCRFPLHLKSRNRLHWLLADRQANEQEPGSRALLLDMDGRLTETSTSCFWAVIDGALKTPAHNVLNSMSARLVQEAAEHLGLRVEKTDLRPSDLADCSEAFLSSTPSGLLPVRSVEGREMPTGTAFPVLNQILAAWKKITGTNPLAQILHD